MTARTLERAVARATGESLATIRRRGFSLVDPAETEFDPEPALAFDAIAGSIVNWDELDGQRCSYLPQRTAA